MFQANKQSEQQLVVNKPNILDRPKKLSSAGGGGGGIYQFTICLVTIYQQFTIYHLPVNHLPVYHLPFTIYQWRTTTPTRRRRLAGPGPPKWTLGNSR